KKIIKKYEQLSQELLKKVKDSYPEGIEDYLISFETPNGEIQLALPLETEDTSYLIKMPKDIAFDEDETDNSPSDGNLEGLENLEITGEDE
ncbi:MAG: hypothetical protein MI922_12470, partial [Bacteroidales bacterium]|nr:hypothetical protein [Bacteroidales bacterium]